MALNKDNMKSFKLLYDEEQGRIEQVKAFFKLIDEFSKKKAYYYEIRQDNEECLTLSTRILFIVDDKYKFGLEINKCEITYRDFEITNPAITIRTNLNTIIEATLHNFEVLVKGLKGKERADFELAASLVNYIGDYIFSLSQDEASHQNH